MRNRLASLFGAEMQLGISSHALTIARRGAFGKGPAVLFDESASLQELQQRCRAALAGTACAGLPLSITLCDELVRLFMVTPPQNAARLHDLQAAADMRFLSLYGESPGNWRISADWQARTPFLACAAPRALIEECTTLAHALRMPLVGLQAHFVAAWNLAHKELSRAKEPTWLAVLRGNHLTLGIVEPKPRRLLALRGLQLPGERAGLDWLQEQVERTALQSDTVSPSHVLLAGEPRADWSSAGNAKLRLTHLGKSSMPGIGDKPAQTPKPIIKAVSA